MRNMNTNKMREQVIINMCYTYRHDYSLLDNQTKTVIYNTMANILDNDISPVMKFVKPSLWKRILNVLQFI